MDSPDTISTTRQSGLFGQVARRLGSNGMLVALVLAIAASVGIGFCLQKLGIDWLALEFFAWSRAAADPAIPFVTLQARMNVEYGLWLDFAFIAAYLLALVLLGAYLAGRAIVRADLLRDAPAQANVDAAGLPEAKCRRLSALALLAIPLVVIAAACDITENLSLLRQLELPVEPIAGTAAEAVWLQVAAWAAAIKFVLLALAATLLAIALQVVWTSRADGKQVAGLGDRLLAVLLLALLVATVIPGLRASALLHGGCGASAMAAGLLLLLGALERWTRRTAATRSDPAHPLTQDALIQAERKAMGIAKTDDRPLFGIALSGGGIRSATFALGILQSLARWKLLDKAHYLSTVSGGGYVGGFLHAWIRRSRDAAGQTGDVDAADPQGRGVRHVQTCLASRHNDLEQIAEVQMQAAKALLAQDACPEKARVTATADAHAELSWLRRYSRYLIPRIGLGSGDTAGLLGSMLRSITLNFLYVLSTLAVLILLTLMAIKLAAITLQFQPIILAIALAVAAVALLMFTATQGLVQQFAEPAALRPILGAKTMARVNSAILLLLMLALVFGGQAWLAISLSDCSAVPSWHLPSFLSGLAAQQIPACSPSTLTVVGTQALLALIIGAYFIGSLAGAAVAPAHHARYRWGARAMLGALVGSAIGAGLMVLCVLGLRALPMHWAAQFVVGIILAPVVVSAAIMLAGIFNVAITTRRGQSDLHLEYWARIGGAGILQGLLVTAALLVVLYGPRLIGQAHNLNWAAIAVWLLTTGAGVLTAAGRGSGDQNQASWRNRLLPLVPPLFIAGLLAMISYLLQRSLDSSVSVLLGWRDLAGYSEPLLQWLRETPWGSFCAPLLVFMMVSALFAWRLDINRHSPSQLYRYRLVRGYLGASNMERNPEPSTNFDPRDDLPLADLAQQRPYPLINTTINISPSTTQLDWQDRQAASFLLSPLYCGHIPVPTEPVDSRPIGELQVRARNRTPTAPGLSLGAAISYSGAAVDSWMGYHSNPAVSFLLSMFNLRLGAWLPNRVDYSGWNGHAPGVLLLRELLGGLRADAPWLRLSDGGHFENLGLYELLRRKPALVICSDGGADPKRAFEDLGNAIRKCRIDFNIEIEIDVSALKPAKPVLPDDLGRSQRGYAIGRIVYPGTATHGVLLYFKTSLIAGLSSDIEHYARANPEFPNQSTVDQFFDEAQFESYRKLARDICDRMAEDLAPFQRDRHGSEWGDDPTRPPPPQPLAEASISDWCNHLLALRCSWNPRSD